MRMRLTRYTRLGILPLPRVVLALAVAYLLVLQMVVAGFVSGVQAAPSGGDLHAELCLGSGQDDGGGAALPDHPDCCRQGCPMLGALGLLPPSLALAEPAFNRAPARVAAPPGAPHRLWRDPRRARAPPSARARLRMTDPLA